MTHSNTPELGAGRTRPAVLGILAVLTLWALVPEVRRLIDWRSGFAAVSIVSVVPLAALLVPLVPLVYSGALKRVDSRLLALAWVWFGGFTAAFVVALLAGTDIAAAAYAYAEFCLPAAFGVWVASLDIDRAVLARTIARFLLVLAMPLSFYAMAQLAQPPAWDVAWMRNANLVSIGIPLPFQFRVFSTLNSPGLFADFLVITILFNLPLLRKPRPLQLLAVAICAAGLALTMVRSDWLALVLGIGAYLALSPNRLATFTRFGVSLLAILALGSALPAIVDASSFAEPLGSRLSTFASLGSDTSYLDRSNYLGAPLSDALHTPQGSGLGVLGTAAKLTDRGTTKDFDNGYIARLTEMGWFGTACYLLATLGAFAFVVGRRSAGLAGVVPAVAAVQLALIGLDFSSDHHSALSGVFFWLSLALVTRREADVRL
jgi:hypothetical protein